MRGDKKGFGKTLYLEWLLPVVDYFCSSKRNEIIFEVIVPALTAVIVTFICININVVNIATRKMADVLITLTSILIGFSAMLVTLLLTSGGSGVDELKKIKTEIKVHNREINLFQKLHIQFVYILISEIILLIFVLLFYFLLSIFGVGSWQYVFLGIFVYMTLNILLSILRGITNVYFSYYK